MNVAGGVNVTESLASCGSESKVGAWTTDTAR